MSRGSEGRPPDDDTVDVVVVTDVRRWTGGAYSGSPRSSASIISAADCGGASTAASIAGAVGVGAPIDDWRRFFFFSD